MDTTLVAGLLTIAGTASSGVLTLAGLIVKRHLAFLSKLEANDDEKTKSLGTIATELTRTREVQQEHTAKISALEVTIEDRRLSEAVAEMRGVSREIGNITGQHAAIAADRADAMGEEPAEVQRLSPVRLPRASRPR